ncbi:prepilin-type N-terminal cleavage/methylation domain-containing protein [Thiofaba sp. EF100]|uniref:type IV pilus modification PilV family protein n=1 Tax=Thiofaba sp. EF100 TaxID=3121274 RepID=UPI003221573D
MRRSSHGPGPGPVRGFSLLEVVVAFSILALAMGVLMALFSQGLSNARVARDYSRALQLAQSRLAEVGVTSPLRSGAEDGVSGGLAWRVEAVERPREGKSPVRAYEVTVEVEADAGRRVTLRSLRLVGSGR